MLQASQETFFHKKFATTQPLINTVAIWWEGQGNSRLYSTNWWLVQKVHDISQHTVVMIRRHWTDEWCVIDCSTQHFFNQVDKTVLNYVVHQVQQLLLSVCFTSWSTFSHCLSSFLLPSLSISQSIASCVFSSLRDTQLFPGRSGSWLSLDEAIKTTADWNRLREQQCKLKGARVVKKGVNSNRLALQNKEALTVFMGSVSLMRLQWAVQESVALDGCIFWLGLIDFHLFVESLIIAYPCKWQHHWLLPESKLSGP